MNRSPAARSTSGPWLPLIVLLNAIGLAAVYLAATVDIAQLVPVTQPAPDSQPVPGAPAGAPSRPTGNGQAGVDPPSRSPGGMSVAMTAADAGTLADASSDRDEVLARPLFRPDRRPWQPIPAAPFRLSAAPAPPPVVEPPLPPPDIRLVGLVRSGETVRALIRSGAAPAARSYVRGDLIGGWRLSEVGRDRIVLEARGERREVMLDRARGDDGPPQVPPSRSEDSSRTDPSRTE